MQAEIVLQQSPDAIALLVARERLAAVRIALAERESELAQVRAQLKAFDHRYLHQVGMLYAELDELEARICEREVDLYDSDAARRRAREARQRAQETQDAAASGGQEPEEFDPPPTLKSLFREVARRIHPDFAGDETEQKHFTLLMAQANDAYSRCDLDTLQRMLDDHLEVYAAGTDDATAAELSRIARQIQHADRDLVALESEEALLLGSEIGQLYLQAEDAAGDERNLLDELAATLRAQVADAQYRFDFINRQIANHGK